jgi:hypothetical protein
MKSVLVGAGPALAFALTLIASPSFAQDFHCPKPGTRLSFNTNSPIEILGQEGLSCLVKAEGGKTFRMLLGINSDHFWADNHVEKLFPFKVGNEVEYTSSADSSHVAANLLELTIVYYQDNVKVLREEKLATKVGTFDTWVIEDRQISRSRMNGTWVTTYWWAPELGYTVKKTFEVRAGLGSDSSFEIASLTMPTTVALPISNDPLVLCHLNDSADMEISLSVCNSRRGTIVFSSPPATAPTPAPITKAAPTPTTPLASSVQDRLNTLKALLDSKTITPEEYAAKRKEILKSL